jgi:hypothetical protein
MYNTNKACYTQNYAGNNSITCNIIDFQKSKDEKDCLKITLPNECQKHIFKNILFELTNYITIEQLKKIIYKSNFNIIIDDISYSLPLSFYFDLGKIEKYDNNKIIFYFPDKFIELFTLNSTIICTIDNWNDNNYFDKISLIEDVIFYENNMKKNLFFCNHKFFTQKIIYHNLLQNINDNNSTFEKEFYIKKNIKGFFIQCNNYNELQNLQFNVHFDPLIIYDKLLLYLYSNKISDNLFYISFSKNNDYNENDEKSYENSLNTEKIDFFKIILHFENKPLYLNIYFLFSEFIYLKDGVYY